MHKRVHKKRNFLMPTQIHAEAKKFANEIGLRAVVVYGGLPISFQLLTGREVCASW